MNFSNVDIVNHLTRPVVPSNTVPTLAVPTKEAIDADGYYGEELGDREELDLSFLDDFDEEAEMKLLAKIRRME